MKKKEQTTEIEIMRIRQGEVNLCIKGIAPLILNAMSNKAKHELLMPKGRKTAADKAQNLKHNPIEEYRDSVYKTREKSAKTRIYVPATAFKGAIASAALDIPGAKKAQIGRLVYVEGDYVEIYGIPQLFMSVVRTADMNKTPDIRTRAILPEWAAFVKIKYMVPAVSENAIVNLAAAAGALIGVGDFRQEKGRGNYGRFELAEKTDKDFARIVKTGTKAAQDAALNNPDTYDDETARLYRWFNDELKKR